MNNPILHTADPHLLLLFLAAIFSLASMILASVTVLNKIRLRNVRFSWKSGKLFGYPLFSSLFLAVTLGLFALSFMEGSLLQKIHFLLYFWMGAGWFVTSYLASKRYITENGIIKNINDPSQSVQWYQIRDFVEQVHSGHTTFIFLYRENEMKGPASFVRLELKVPGRHREKFKKLINHKLGRQINCYSTADLGIEHFDLR